MGWKAATLFICDDDPAYLATRPKIDHEKLVQTQDMERRKLDDAYGEPLVFKITKKFLGTN